MEEVKTSYNNTYIVWEKEQSEAYYHNLMRQCLLEREWRQRGVDMCNEEKERNKAENSLVLHHSEGICVPETEEHVFAVNVSAFPMTEDTSPVDTTGISVVILEDGICPAEATEISAIQHDFL